MNFLKTKVQFQCQHHSHFRSITLIMLLLKITPYLQCRCRKNHCVGAFVPPDCS